MSNYLVNVFWNRVATAPSAVAMIVAGSKQGETANIHWQESGLAVSFIVRQLLRARVVKGDRVAIMGWNSPEWVWADMAIQSLGAVSVPIYPNSSTDQVAQVIKDAGVRLVVTADAEQSKKLEIADGRLLADLILLESAPGRPLHREFVDGVWDRKFFRDCGMFLDLFLRGARTARAVELADDDLATIIYTSGSSGIPKGCMITHGNVAAELESLEAAGYVRSKRDRYLSYLPMAHVYERFNGMALSIWFGVPSAFCAVDKAPQGMRAYHPTLICGVPAVWRKVKESVENPVDQPIASLNRAGVWAPLLRWAVATKDGSWQHKLADRLLFTKIRAKLGGRLQLGVSGGAPSSPEVLRFFEKLGIEIVEGYGLTETTGGVIITRQGARRVPGSVGLALPGVEVRIVMGEEDPEYGEIQIRGKQVFKGYWGKPEATAEAFSADGWFKTGDYGKMDASGNVFVIGRLDGKYKLEGAKFVVKEAVETALQKSSIVQYGVPVAQARKFTTALIFVNVALARTLVKGAVPADVESRGEAAAYLAEQPEVVAAVAAAVKLANADLQPWETVKKYKIMPVEASVGNGLLTQTLKIKTKEAHKRFKVEIEQLYS